MSGENFTAKENRIIGRSGDSGLMKRFRVGTVVTAVSFTLLLLGVGLASRDWRIVFGIALMYIVITSTEKLAYASVLESSKSIIVKLFRRINELEGRD